MNRRRFLAALSGSVLARPSVSTSAEPKRSPSVDGLLPSSFNWLASSPLVSPANRPHDPCHAIKDPSIVYYKDRWHLFCTIRSKLRSHQIEYLAFGDFEDANSAERHVLTLTDGYFAAPQIFYFSPHKSWYLIYQVLDNSRKPALQPAYSTTTDVADPASWTKPNLLYSTQPENVKQWIDFWVICDPARAHLFFTSLDGQMWRAETKLSDFPGGWTRPSVVLRGDIFEASHTYHLTGQDKFLTVIEARKGQATGLLERLLETVNLRVPGRRYYKAYVADRLDGSWRTLSGSGDDLFAGPTNVRDSGTHWTDSFSHGELIRDGFEETLSVDPVRLHFLFQGVSDQDRAGKEYGDIPWKLGMLEEVR